MYVAKSRGFARYGALDPVSACANHKLCHSLAWLPLWRLLFRRLTQPLSHHRTKLIDWRQPPLALAVPEGPAIAGGKALYQRADLVDRAGDLADRERAFGADERRVTPGFVGQIG